MAAILLLRLALDSSSQAPRQLQPGVQRVQRVIDGDTVLLANGIRVRLQGIDTPETVSPNHPEQPWGWEAKQFTERFVASAGGEIELTLGAERLDRYGRSLAFVWHGEELLNERLVQEGLARARLQYRYSGTMKRRLAEAEQQARAAKRGMWSADSPRQSEVP